MNQKETVLVLEMVEAHDPLASEAKKKAIRSLKAWDKVIEKFRMKCDAKAYKCHHCAFCGYEFELRDILRIIQEHLEIGLSEEK